MRAIAPTVKSSRDAVNRVLTVVKVNKPWESHQFYLVVRYVCTFVRQPGGLLSITLSSASWAVVLCAHCSARSPMCRLSASPWMVGEDVGTSQWMDIIDVLWRKQCSLDGHDGLQHFWRGMRVSIRQTNRPLLGRGSFMVWCGFSRAGKTEVANMVGKQNY